jgi:GNAT superfamily N-acetyltransferase
VLRFVPCDPEEPPASELLGEMAAELNAMYWSASRLDLPKLEPFELRPPDGIFLVGWQEGEQGEAAVAGGGLRHLDDGLAEVKRMFVRPGARSRGVAGALLAALEGEARSLGYDRLRLDTGPKQVHAIRLYAGVGFVPVEPYNDNPFACFWGEKDLRRSPGPGLQRGPHHGELQG